MGNRKHVRKIEVSLAIAVFLWAGFLVGCSSETAPATVTQSATAAVTSAAGDDLTPTVAVTVVSTVAPATAISEEAMTDSPAVSTPFPGAEQLIALARQDLAQRLDVDAAEIAVDSVEAVIWPDSSMGCPQPGMVYTQVQQDGYRILLRVEKEVFAYHGGGAREPFLCEDAGDSGSAPPPGGANE